MVDTSRPACGATREFQVRHPVTGAGPWRQRSFQLAGGGRVRTRPSQAGRAPVPGALTPAAFRSGVLPPNACCWVPNNTAAPLLAPNGRPTDPPRTVSVRPTDPSLVLASPTGAPLAVLVRRRPGFLLRG